MTSFSTYASRFLSSAYGPFRTDDGEASVRVAAGTASSRLVGRGAARTPQQQHAGRRTQHSSRRGGGGGGGGAAAALDADPLFYSALYGYDPLHQHRPPAAHGAGAAHHAASPVGSDPFGDPYDVDDEHQPHSDDDDDEHDSRNLHSVALPQHAHWDAPRAEHGSSILNPTPHSSDSGRSSTSSLSSDDAHAATRQLRRATRRAYHGDDDDGDAVDDDDEDDDDDEFGNSEDDDPLARSSRIIYVQPEPVADQGWGPWFTRMANGSCHDRGAAVAFATAAAFTLLVAGTVALGATPHSAPESPSTRPSSYYTITRTLPILILLTLLSVVASLANLAILRHVAQRLGSNPAASWDTGPQAAAAEEQGPAKVWVRNALLAIPAVLGLGWVWALAGSFVYDDEQWTGGGWSTTGLRLFSLIPLAMALLFARSVYKRRAALSRSIAVLELSCSILLAHPHIFLVALAQLGIFILLTIPFLTIFARLFLIGHFAGVGGGGGSKGDAGSAAKVWITSTRAAWLAWFTFGTWLWTWAVLRGIQRVTIAGVVSHWYFHRSGPDQAGPNAPVSAPAANATAAAAAKTGAGASSTPPRKDGKSANATASEAEDATTGPSAPGAWLAEEDRPRSTTHPGQGHGQGQGHGPSGRGSANANDTHDARLPPTAEDVVRAALARATGPALGTIALAALVLSLLRLATLVAWTARRVSKAIARTAQRRLASVASTGRVGPISLGPGRDEGVLGMGMGMGMGAGMMGRLVVSRGVSIWLVPAAHGAAVLAGLTAVAQSVSEYALVYTGVTGEAFWTGARRAGRLVGRHGVRGVMDGLVINLVLDMTTIALSFLAGVAGFLFSAHQLHVPADAPLVGLLCAAVPYWTLRLCADVLRNAADTVYLCWAIDRQLRDEHCVKADEAFQTEEDGRLPF